MAGRFAVVFCIAEVAFGWLWHHFLPLEMLRDANLLHALLQLLILWPLFHFWLYRPFAALLEQRDRALGEFLAAERRFLDIATNSAEWLWEVDELGRYTYASPQCEHILGRAPDELLGRYFYETFHPDDRDALRQAAFDAFARREPIVHMINRNLHRDGHSVWLITNGTPVISQAGEFLGYRGADLLVNDQASTTDLLTGALNRQGFRLLAEHQLLIARRSGLPVTMVYADVDNLKPINDQLGHQAGDRALIDLARIIRSCTRGSDTFGRLGGDEFVVLLTGSGPEVSDTTVLKKIEAEIHSFNALERRPYTLALSAAAVTLTPADSASLDELLERADRAMYVVKRARRAARR